MRKLLIIFFLIFSSLSLSASPGYPRPVEVIQPDGTKLCICVRGDEYFRYLTTIDGSIIAQGEDGFYYYANYDSGVLNISSTRVNSIGIGQFGRHDSSLPFGVADMIAKKNGREEQEFSLTKATASNALPKKMKVLVIPVQFSNVKFSMSDPRGYYERMVNQRGFSDNGATGSVNDYFEANLRGHCDIDFSVTNVVTLSTELSYYGNNEVVDNSYIKYDAELPRLVSDACRSINSQVNFSSFDGDGDGAVDNVVIIYAGYSEAEGGSSSSIWPVSAKLTSQNLILDGVKIYSYSCVSELSGSYGKNFSGIGVFCHEMCHLLGMKDLYDTDYENNGQSKALWGSLSIMDHGCFNNFGKTPPNFCAIDRELLGLPNAGTLRNGMNYLLEPISKNGTFYKVPIQKNDNEYFLFEVREESGWDEYIGGEGLLVYHIDKSNSPVGNIIASVRWATGTINNYSLHECADLVEANPNANSVKDVFFPSADSSEFSAFTNPPFLGWGLAKTGIKLCNIKKTVNGVSFNIEPQSDERTLKVLSHSVTAYQTEASIRWSADINNQANWVLRYGLKSDDSKNYHQTALKDQNVDIFYLLPGREYIYEIFHKGEIMNGDTTRAEFQTVNINSRYPRIAGVKSYMNVGDTVSLRMYNLLESVKMLKWYIDGSELPSDQWVIQKSGLVEISGRIEYVSDSSVEVVRRKVRITR